MTVFKIKVFKGKALIYEGLGMARSSFDLWDSAMQRHFPCSVNIMRYEQAS